MSVKSRIAELNARLATKLTARGVTASEDETTTALINKVDDIPEGSGIDWSQCTDWRYFSYNNNRNSIVEKLKYSDTANGTNFGSMYQNCSDLTSVPQIDTSKGTKFNAMYYNCSNLTSVPQIDTSKGIDFQSMYYYCSKLTSVPQMDTSKGTAFYSMFYNCTKLITIPLLNMSSVTNITKCANMFYNCTTLKNVTFEGTIRINGNFSVFSYSNNLTVESLMSFINALENMSDTATYTITIGSTNLAKLTEEQIQIATDKRITLQ